MKKTDIETDVETEYVILRYLYGNYELGNTESNHKHINKTRNTKQTVFNVTKHSA